MTRGYSELEARIAALINSESKDNMEQGKELQAKYETFMAIEELQKLLEDKSSDTLIGPVMIVLSQSEIDRFIIALNTVRQRLKIPLGLK